MNPPPGWERRKVDYVRGPAELVFPDGKRITVTCEVSVVKEFQDGYPFKSAIEGRVWGFSAPNEAKNYLGKDCILEIGERRLSMFIKDQDGTIAHTPGVRKGFPGLADQSQ